MKMTYSMGLFFIAISVTFCLFTSSGEEEEMPPAVGRDRAPTPEQREALKQLSLEELLSKVRQYGSMTEAEYEEAEPPGPWVEFVLIAMLSKSNWLEAIDPLLAAYTSMRNLPTRIGIVKFLGAECGTGRVPDQAVDKIQTVFISNLQRREDKMPAGLRQFLVRGLMHSVTRPLLSDKNKEAMREQGIDPDIPLHGRDRVVSALTQALNDENKLVSVVESGFRRTFGRSCRA